MDKNSMKTKYQKMKEAKDMAIYNERERLLSAPNAMATEVDNLLMKKFKIHAKSTIWLACKRAKGRLDAETGSKA